MIAWRYFIPRPRYFQSLKIATACPEISRHLDRIALYSVGNALVTTVLVIGFVAVFPIFWIADKLKSLLGLLPDFSGKRIEALRDAHSIVPVEEIRKRIGLPPERGILMRKLEFRESDDIHCTANNGISSNIEAGDNANA